MEEKKEISIRKTKFKLLEKNMCSYLFSFLESVDIVQFRGISSQFHNYFKSNSETLRIYIYIMKCKEDWSKDIKSNKIRVINMMTDKKLMTKITRLFKITEDKYFSICKEIALYYHNIEFEQLNNLFK